MKHYAQPIHYLACLAVAGLLCSCRAAYQRDTHSQEDTHLSQSGSTLHTTTGTIATQVKTEKDEQGKYWKITYRFDTSQPTNPTTGLPPISDIEVEGSENTTQTKQETNESVQLSDSTSTKNDLTLDTHKESETQTKSDGGALTGVDDGLRYGLIIGIPLALIIFIRIYYARKKDSPK